MSDETRAKLNRALDAYVMAVQADPEAVGDGRLDAEEAYSAALTAHEHAAKAEAVLAFAEWKRRIYGQSSSDLDTLDLARDYVKAQSWSVPGQAERGKP